MKKALNYTMRTASVVIGQGYNQSYREVLALLQKLELKMQLHIPQALESFCQRVKVLA